MSSPVSINQVILWLQIPVIVAYITILQEE
jgi:hypothetical protein